MGGLGKIQGMQRVSPVLILGKCGLLQLLRRLLGLNRMLAVPLGMAAEGNRVSDGNRVSHGGSARGNFITASTDRGGRVIR